MDKFIARFARADDDLIVSAAHGVAYQRDMIATARYDDAYFAKVSAYEGGAIAMAVNTGRCAMLARYLSRGARVLDIGAGTGAFVREALTAGFDAKGYEVMVSAAERLRAAELYADDPSGFDAVTLWDVIEHLEDPGAILERVQAGAKLFASIPIFDDLSRIRESRHYRPGEHLMYFSARGFIAWMAAYDYQLLGRSSHETDAGRESIGAFAFCKDGGIIRCCCGGEMQLESFNHPKRPVEWFLRCRECGASGPSAGTPDQAEPRWKEARAAA